MSNPMIPVVREWRDTATETGRYDELAEALSVEIRRLGAVKQRSEAVPVAMVDLDRQLVTASAKEHTKLLGDRVTLMAERDSLPEQIAECRRRVTTAQADWVNEARQVMIAEETAILRESAEVRERYEVLHRLMARQDSMPFRMRLVGNELAETLREYAEVGEQVEPIRARLQLISRVRTALAESTPPDQLRAA